MNSKKVNILFLSIILLHFATVILLSVLRPVYSINLIDNYLISEGILVVPALAVLLWSREKIPAFLRFKRIKPGSVLMIVLFTMLTSPTITLVNLISQLFVRNTALEMNSLMLQYPMWVNFFFVAVCAAFCEEAVCRGVVYQGYKKSGSGFAAMILSALIFAGIHLNFNQASYAFVMGILAVLLVETTGSIWSSILYHFLINGWSVFISGFYTKAGLDTMSVEAAESFRGNNQMMMASISLFLLLAAITLPLAMGVLVWLENHEGRSGKMRLLWEERKLKKDKMITIPMLIAFILCLAYMIVGVLATL